MSKFSSRAKTGFNARDEAYKQALNVSRSAFLVRKDAKASGCHDDMMSFESSTGNPTHVVGRRKSKNLRSSGWNLRRRSQLPGNTDFLKSLTMKNCDGEQLLQDILTCIHHYVITTSGLVIVIL